MTLSRGSLLARNPKGTTAPTISSASSFGLQASNGSGPGGNQVARCMARHGGENRSISARCQHHPWQSTARDAGPGSALLVTIADLIKRLSGGLRANLDKVLE